MSLGKHRDETYAFNIMMHDFLVVIDYCIMVVFSLLFLNVYCKNPLKYTYCLKGFLVHGNVRTLPCITCDIKRLLYLYYGQW